MWPPPTYPGPPRRGHPGPTFLATRRLLSQRARARPAPSSASAGAGLGPSLPLPPGLVFGARHPPGVLGTGAQGARSTEAAGISANMGRAERGGGRLGTETIIARGGGRDARKAPSTGSDVSSTGQG